LGLTLLGPYDIVPSHFGNVTLFFANRVGDYLQRMVLAFNLFGDGWREALDPRLKP